MIFSHLRRRSDIRGPLLCHSPLVVSIQLATQNLLGIRILLLAFIYIIHSLHRTLGGRRWSTPIFSEEIICFFRCWNITLCLPLQQVFLLLLLPLALVSFVLRLSGRMFLTDSVSVFGSLPGQRRPPRGLRGRELGVGAATHG